MLAATLGMLVFAGTASGRYRSGGCWRSRGLACIPRTTTRRSRAGRGVRQGCGRRELDRSRIVPAQAAAEVASGASGGRRKLPAAADLRTPSSRARRTCRTRCAGSRCMSIFCANAARAVRGRRCRAVVGQHAFAARLRSLAASRSAASAAFSAAHALADTHLPSALRLLVFVPYFCSNAALDSFVVPRSALQAADDEDVAALRSRDSSRALAETRLPKALRLPAVLLREGLARRGARAALKAAFLSGVSPVVRRGGSPRRQAGQVPVPRRRRSRFRFAS